MARLSTPLAKLATHLVHERHKREAKIEAQQLRRTLERLVARGLTDTELLNALQHDHWENRIAVRMNEAKLPWEPAP